MKIRFYFLDDEQILMECLMEKCIEVIKGYKWKKLCKIFV